MPGRYLKSDLRIQQYLIIFELFLLLYGLFKDNEFYSRLVLSLLVLNGLLYFTTGLKVWIFTKHRTYFHYYQDHSHLVFSLLLSAGIFFARWVFCFYSLVISTSNYLFFILVSLIAYVFSSLLYSFAGLTIERVHNAFLTTAVVLAFIPVIIPLSNELHFSLIILQGISPGYGHPSFPEMMPLLIDHHSILLPRKNACTMEPFSAGCAGSLRL